MTNVPIGTYLVKIKTATGCVSYDNTVKIIPFLTSFPYYSSTNPTHCDGLGSITITTTATEYSFDDGVTWTTSNIANNLPLGTYLIRTKDALGCISNYNSVVLTGQFLPSPVYTTEAPYCSTKGSITITSPGTEFSFDGGTTWQTSNIFSNLDAGSYVIKVKNAQGCTSPNVYVYLSNFENTSPEYSIDDAGCDKYATLTITTPADFYSFDGGTTWTTNNSLGNLNGGTSFVLQIRKGTNCYSYTSSAYISSYFRALPVVTNYSTLICDELNNDKETIDLTVYSPFLVANSASHNFTHYNTLTAAENQINSELITAASYYNLNVTHKIIYVRVTDTYGCSSIATIELTLIPSPVITLADKYYLCEDSTVTISEPTVFDSYLWSTGSTDPTIVISQPGDYSLTVTQNHGSVICPTVKIFPVILSNPAIITHFDLQDWTIYNNTITVNVTGLGDYEYSLDGIKYQDSNVFEHLEPGENKVYVRDKNGCGVTVSDEVYLLIYPKFFTPNGDGFNDTWRITFSEKEPNLTVKIFDRHGKFMKLLDAASYGWDGTYLDAPAPASDYWFTVIRQNGKVYTEHFTLKR
jgi:gliding motility-associated-like protein